MRVNLKNNKGNVPSIERRRRHHHLVRFRAGASARSAQCARPRRQSVHARARAATEWNKEHAAAASERVRGPRARESRHLRERRRHRERVVRFCVRFRVCPTAAATASSASARTTSHMCAAAASGRIRGRRAREFRHRRECRCHRKHVVRFCVRNCRVVRSRVRPTAATTTPSASARGAYRRSTRRRSLTARETFWCRRKRRHHRDVRFRVGTAPPQSRRALPRPALPL